MEGDHVGSDDGVWLDCTEFDIDTVEECVAETEPELDGV